MKDFNEYMKTLDFKESATQKSVPGESLARYRENYDAAFRDYQPKPSPERHLDVKYLQGIDDE